MKRLEIPQKLVYEKFTYTKKFYIHEITTINLSKIYLLKNAKKTCKPNKCNLNRNWKMKTGIIVDFIFQGFINRSNHQHMFWKMLLIKCRKNSSFWKKIKTEINWIQASSKHIPITFWNLQNTYLAKHLRMLDSAHAKIVYTIFKDYMIISTYQQNSQLTFTSSKLT